MKRLPDFYVGTSHFSTALFVPQNLQEAASQMKRLPDFYVGTSHSHMALFVP